MLRATLASVILVCALGAAQAQSSPQAQLDEAFKGKTLVVRHFYFDQKIDFDQNGQATGQPKPGPWTLATVVIEKCKAGNDGFTLSGKRVDNYSPYIKVGKVELRVHGLSSAPSREDLEKLKSEIFYKSEAETKADLPSYWRDTEYGEGPKPYPGGKPLEPGGDVMPPRAIHKPNAKYPRSAGDSNIQGNCTLTLVVGTDGLPHDIRVARAVGLGFEDAAVQAVEKWRFEPGTRNGKPVPVLITLDVSFTVE